MAAQSDTKGDKGDKGDQGEKGEIGERGVSGQWFRSWFSTREPFITFIFFIILSVLSFGTVVSAHQTNNYIQQRSNANKARESCLVVAFASAPVSDSTLSREIIIA